MTSASAGAFFYQVFGLVVLLGHRVSSKGGRAGTGKPETPHVIPRSPPPISGGPRSHENLFVCIAGMFIRRCWLILILVTLLVAPCRAVAQFSGKVVGISDGDTLPLSRRPSVVPAYLDRSPRSMRASAGS